MSLLIRKRHYKTLKTSVKKQPLLFLIRNVYLDVETLHEAELNILRNILDTEILDTPKAAELDKFLGIFFNE